MMNKERQLLQKWVRRYIAREGLNDSYREPISLDDVYIETLSLLSQPETKQEPVAWMPLSDIEWMNIVNAPKILELTNDRHDSEEAVNLAVKMTEEKCKENNSRPKREPLTGKEISQGFRADKNANNAESYWAGVALAEKHYGVKINED